MHDTSFMWVLCLQLKKHLSIAFHLFKCLHFCLLYLLHFINISISVFKIALFLTQRAHHLIADTK